jgi:hypothetical protein
VPLLVKAFWAPKAGNSPDEYEDALAIDMEAQRFAIADGATESSFAKQWAQLLTSGFVVNPGPLLRKGERRSRKSWILEWLAPLQEAWHQGIDLNALPWFAEEKARSGAFATFLGMELEDPLSAGTPRRWKAIAIGDCVLFKVRNNQLKVAFPLNDPGKFSVSPDLICSNRARNQDGWKDVRVKRGEWYPGDVFLLSTDAFAQWFLTQEQAGNKPWSLVCSLSSQGEFERLATQLRTERLVRNDDMTLITIIAG